MSPLITPDTSDAFSKMEPGAYKAHIDSCGVQLSKEKQTPMAVPQFSVEYNGKPVKRTVYLVTRGPGSNQFTQLLRSCGFDELADIYDSKDIAADEKPPFNTDDLVGHEVIVHVVDEIDKRDGKTLRDRIQSFSKV